MKPGIKKRVRLLITSNQQKGKKKQNGIALLVLVIAIALAISTYYFSTISIVDIKVDNIEKTQKTLKKAKQALLAYVMNYRGTVAGSGNSSQGPGNFPCPDDTLDGYSNTGVGVVTPGCGSFGAGTMGRFPWATIQAEEYKDMSGEFLWYAVSSNFANQADKNINTATTGEITVRNSNGSIRNNGTMIDGIVAVIIAPGKTLKRDDGLIQSRSTTAEKDNPKNYLDIAFGEDNASFINSDTDGFIMGEVRDNNNNNLILNDLMVVITYSELMELVHASVGEAISVVINDYFTACGAYPDASAFDPTKPDADFDSGPTPFYSGHIPSDLTVTPSQWNTGCTVGISLPDWFVDEEWHKVTYYEYSPTIPCVPGDCLVVNNSNPAVNNADAVIVFAGRDLNATRHVNDINQYFEGENNILNRFYDADETEDYIRVIAP